MAKGQKRSNREKKKPKKDKSKTASLTSTPTPALTWGQPPGRRTKKARS